MVPLKAKIQFSSQKRPVAKVLGILPASKEDKENKSVLVSSKVGQVISCSQCSKPRCIYTNAKITNETQRVQIKRKVEENSYSCGEPLFPDGHSMRKIIIVRQELNCATNMEASYYSASIVLPLVCCYCGSVSGSPLYNGKEIDELKKKFSKVRPICSFCFKEGKQPVTWGATNFAAKKKKK